MSKANSPLYARGLRDGIVDATRSPRERRGFEQEGLRSWLYRQGFAHGFLHTRALIREALTPAPRKPAAARTR